MKISENPAIRAILILPAYITGMFLAALAAVNFLGLTNPQDFILFALLASVFFQAVLTIVFRKFLDRKSISSIGFSIAHEKIHPVAGLSSAIAILGLTSIILYLTGQVQWHKGDVPQSGFLLMFLAILLVSFTEEMMYRGYIFSNLRESLPAWQALTLSAVIFSLAHISNPGQSVIAIINIFLGGLIMGLTYMHNRSIWHPFLFHAGWNLFQGPVMGFNVSGVEIPSLLKLEAPGAAWLTGGEFGLEGSILLGFFLLLWFVFLLRQTGEIRKIPGG